VSPQQGVKTSCLQAVSLSDPLEQRQCRQQTTQVVWNDSGEMNK